MLRRASQVLNSLGGQGRRVLQDAPLTPCQVYAVRSLLKRLAQVPPRALGESAHEAFQALLGFRPGDSDEVALGGKALYKPLFQHACELLASGDGLMRAIDV